MESAHRSAALGSKESGARAEARAEEAPESAGDGLTASPRRVLLPHRRHPLRTLIVLFAAWKLYLLAIAFLAGSVGPAYDTSGALLAGASSSSPRSTSSDTVHANGTKATGTGVVADASSLDANVDATLVDNVHVYTTAAGAHTAHDNSLVTRLTSWDAIYYVETARRGHVFEQEWAFGTGLAVLVSALHDGLSRVLSLDASEALLAVAVAHVSHLLSVLIFYRLGRLVWSNGSGGSQRNVRSKSNDNKSRNGKESNGHDIDNSRGSCSSSNLAFVAACLHILSPGGLFLSAPNAESTFACLSFAGYLAYAAGVVADSTASSHGSDDSHGSHGSRGHPTTDGVPGSVSAGPSGVSGSHEPLVGSAGPSSPSGGSSVMCGVSPTAGTFRGDLLRLLAGILFGVATTFRSNGILNGIPFAYEAVAGVASLLQQSSLSTFRRLIFVGLGGVAVGAGLVVPQAVAYRQFCLEPSGVPGEDLRPWCTQMLPSIYTFVQEHYWNVGFLRYWTLPNVPLFLLAAPMLYVLIRSSLDTLAEIVLPLEKEGKEVDNSASLLGGVDPRLVPLVLSWTGAQLLLATLAITNYHVQIISRISCAYPVWYWWLARSLADGSRASLASGVVIFMVMYASIQGVLFASFLPPA